MYNKHKLETLNKHFDTVDAYHDLVAYIENLGNTLDLYTLPESKESMIDSIAEIMIEIYKLMVFKDIQENEVSAIANQKIDDYLNEIEDEKE
jgi:hypothetical protein